MYYEDVPENTVKKTRRQVDRDEVYLYEKKINKRLFDMDVDDLIGYFVYCFNNENKTCNFSYLSIPKIASMYRNIWNFYIENIEIIKNPWNNKKMKGKELLKSLGIEGDYVGIGHCVLGYVDGEYPGIPERKDNWVYYVE